MMAEQIFHDHEVDQGHKASWCAGPGGDLRHSDPLDGDLPVPDLLDDHHQLQDWRPM